MEFIEAPAFTRHLPDYLNDDDYRRCKRALRLIPSLEI